MRKTKNSFEFISIIFFILGFSFILSGVLNRIGILPTSESSQGDPGFWFPLLGFLLLTAGFVFLIIAVTKRRSERHLLEEGLRVTGLVTKIEHFHFVRFNKTSPYVIHFSYKFENADYEGHSHFIWSRPSFKPEAHIEVYINKNKPKVYTAKINS